jgi:hypothetical protein
MRATRFAVGLVLLLALAVSVPVGAASAGDDASSLPPSSRKALVAIFDKQMKPFGLRVTRAALVTPEQERDPKGTHLAIYVEPTGQFTPEDYVDGAVDVTKVFLPYVFDRWKGLKSFDVCQEPRPAVDPGLTPAPETQVFATRAGSKLVDWSTVDLATMIEQSRIEAAAAATKKRDPRFTLYVTQHLKNTPAYQAQAGTAANATPTTPTVRGYE